MISRYGIILSLSALLALTACDDAKKKAQDKAAEKVAEAMGVDDAKISTNTDGSQDVTIREGHATVSTGTGLALPEGFPHDIPAYPGWNIQAAAKTDEGFLVHGQSKDKMAVIAKFYNDRLTRAGWKNSNMVSMPQMTVLVFEKDERVANVNIMANQQGSLVQITLPPS